MSWLQCEIESKYVPQGLERIMKQYNCVALLCISPRISINTISPRRAPEVRRRPPDVAIRVVVVLPHYIQHLGSIISRRPIENVINTAIEIPQHLEAHSLTGAIIVTTWGLLANIDAICLRMASVRCTFVEFDCQVGVAILCPELSKLPLQRMSIVQRTPFRVRTTHPFWLPGRP